jgi:Mg2+-importing ATPase
MKRPANDFLYIITLSDYLKKDEILYDFLRKRLSIAVSCGHAHLIVTKGALTNILDACSFAETKEWSIVKIATVQDKIQKNFAAFSN